VIPVNAQSDIDLSAALKAGFGAGTVLAVTLEQKGGSPTGAPQGPIVAKGVATPI
jgi:anti-sigma-K factor RskA